MTLGGLALAVGILVDDATVTIENIERYLEEGHGAARGHPRRRRADRGARAGLHALHLHRVPADVLPGRGRALPVRPAGRGGGLRDARLLRAVADAGADAGDVPAAGRARMASGADAESARARCSGRSSAASSALRRGYRGLLTAADRAGGRCSSRSSSPVCLSRLAAGAVARRELLPDHRQRAVHPAPAGQDRHPHRGDRAAGRPGGGRDPARDPGRASSTTSSTTSACRTAPSTTMYSRSGVIGAADADILVSLKQGHRPTADYVRDAPGAGCRSEFPGVDVLLPARRHRDADPELRTARADRRADRGHRHRGQPPGRRTRS